MGWMKLIRPSCWPLAAASLALLASSAAAQHLAKPAEEAKEGAAAPMSARLLGRGLPSSLAGIAREKGMLEEAPEQPGDRAAPPNDSCATPTIIAGTGVFNFDNTMATTDGLPHFFCNFFGQSQITRDIWYRWTAPQTATFVIDTCVGTSIDTKIAVYTNAGVCPPTDEQLLMCNDDFCSSQSRITLSATAGQVYRIRLGVFPTQAGGPGSLRVQFQAGQDICGFPAGHCQAGDTSNAYEATGAFVFDDFRPAASGVINTVCFTGGYFDGVGDCQADGQDQFTISYHEDIGGFPDFFPFAEFNWTEMEITGPAPTGEYINNTVPSYAYTATHPNVFVNANQCYWIVIHNAFTGEDCAWYWQRGVPGNSIALQSEIGPFPEDIIDADLAFCLNIPLNSSALCQTASPPPNDECATATQIFCFSTRTFSNVFATDNMLDPPFSCRLEGPARGSGTMWYRFSPSATSAAISFCSTTEGDSLVALYSGTCGNLTEIACNDDYCGRRSLLTATNLTVGQTYYIQVASWDYGSRGQYTMQLNCPIPAPPANDTCGGAQLITLQGGSGFAFANTYFASIDSQAPACAFNPLVGPSIWFKVIGTGFGMTAGLCSSSFDTKINLYCGDSCDELICVDQNDDACGDQSRVEWCSQAGQTYYIMVHGFNGAVGDVSLNILSDNEPCVVEEPCATCDLPCPPNAIQEAESCGGASNDGCLANPFAAQLIQCGDTICGQASAIGGVRDTDWYQFNVPVESLVTWRVTADLPVEFFILDDQCPPTILASEAIDRCGEGAAFARLLPGTYRAFVADVDDAYPCGTYNTYIASLTCEPIGACCVGSDCVQTTAADCANRAGDFGGPQSICDITYNVMNCANAFEDIAPTGEALSFEGAGEIVDIGFTFAFFGREYTQVGVSGDGFLGFETSLSHPVNATIPSSTAPNNIIAALWDDFVPFPQGAIYVETRGEAPARRFIVQWDAVPQFLMTDSNTFQAILFEGSNCVELRYGQITSEATPGDYTIGVEDRAGVRGASVNAAMVGFGSCFRFCPVATPAGCEATGCAGDANGDLQVNFDDVTSVLANWGGAGPSGDANGDSTVDFDDVTSVLANWGCGPLACGGDANFDTMVDFDDITSVLANWSGAGPVGDADGSGGVDFDDVTSVIANWGASCGDGLLAGSGAAGPNSGSTMALVD